MMSSPALSLTPPPPGSTKQGHQIVLSEATMDQNYDKLVERLRKKAEELKDTPDGTQYWVGIAGGPGSGKTTTSNKVAERLNKSFGSDSDDFCVVLPMDGFHYSQSELQELDPPDGVYYMKRRGAPWTMNAELCYDLLSKAKQAGCGELPSYCREISDPIPGGVTLSTKHKIVFVEGLYLLWGDDERWAPLQKLWDEQWFIKCPSRDDQRERLVKRSLENWSETKVKNWGPGRAGAEAKVDANDAPNMDIVAPSEKYANVIVESV
ncbi:Phosphoribulokinase uridine kinase family protein [Seminavis robusta]|uniref:Phosphoribulokinase uridine kinase family protein n=1 Tax=Seminavis robusta TaxID=568900 RepID=A0A9N8DTW8_9STRA|nr:Phosphoribulokinase uridine kinase family protein [Seminavis robusta]|eukprot:Sro368_g127990.1 Phosphoribulokinase uridine kinase family protein (265) ;mRNA; r:41280-42192